MYVCVCAYVYVCVSVCVRLFFACVCVYIFVYVCACLCVYVCVYMCVCLSIFVCVYMFVYVCVGGEVGVWGHTLGADDEGGLPGKREGVRRFGEMRWWGEGAEGVQPPPRE